jgi:hypothetical protein
MGLVGTVGGTAFATCEGKNIAESCGVGLMLGGLGLVAGVLATVGRPYLMGAAAVFVPIFAVGYGAGQLCRKNKEPQYVRPQYVRGRPVFA